MNSSASTSTELAPKRARLEASYAEAVAAPLSRKRSMLVALMIDDFVDALFGASPEADDILVFRARLAAATPALALVLELAAMRPGGPALVTESVQVPLAEYRTLTIEDFMVSLYNNHCVQRVLIVDAAGTRHEAHAVLRQAIDVLGEHAIARPDAAMPPAPSAG